MPQQQQQQPDLMDKWKRNTNILYWLCVIHQRAVILPFRKCYGTQALGFPCFFAAILMFAWYVISRDEVMLLWLGFWGLCLAIPVSHRGSAGGGPGVQPV